MDNQQIQQEVVEHYIKAYNNLDTGGMLRDLHEDVLFEDVSNGQVNIRTRGIEAFKGQAESAKNLFRKRAQKISDIKSYDGIIEVQIDYSGILAHDLPNGLKAGDTINIKGKSTFIFKEGKIIQIKDES